MVYGGILGAWKNPLPLQSTTARFEHKHCVGHCIKAAYTSRSSFGRGIFTRGIKSDALPNGMSKAKTMLKKWFSYSFGD